MTTINGFERIVAIVQRRYSRRRRCWFGALALICCREPTTADADDGVLVTLSPERLVFISVLSG